jgi:hypothetical protein
MLDRAGLNGLCAECVVLSGKAILPPFVLVHDSLQRLRIRMDRASKLWHRET